MTPAERVEKRLKGEAVDHIPNLNILMAFAASYIDIPYSRYVKDFNYLVEGNILCCEKFKIDMVSAISDPCREAHDLGAAVVFPLDDVPYTDGVFLQDYSELAGIRVRDPLSGERMLDRIKGVELYRQRVGGYYPILGWVEGALAEACDLRGVHQLMIDFYEAPTFVEELLEICTSQAISFAREQLKAGADFIGIGDAVASLIGPDRYRKYALPYEQRIIEAVHNEGGRAKLHICGDINPLLEILPLTGADIIDCDWMVDFGRAVQVFGESCAACGNFDPVEVLLRGTPEEVRTAVRSCIEAGNSRTIIAAGCEVPRNTPYQNLKAVAEALGRGSEL